MDTLRYGDYHLYTKLVATENLSKFPLKRRKFNSSRGIWSQNLLKICISVTEKLSKVVTVLTYSPATKFITEYLNTTDLKNQNL